MTRISAPTDRTLGHRKPDAHAGFTLMEVVLAMLIMGMLATLAIPYFQLGVGTAVMKAKASEIASLLRRDRNAALRVGGRSSVSFDIRIGVVTSVNLRQSIRMPKGLTLRLLPENREVSFSADGRSSGARIILASRITSIAIDVNRATAAINISEIHR